MNETEKIREIYRSGYQSSPIGLSDKNIRLLISHNCECDNCNKSIFELEDFPNLLRGEVLCEECWREKYMLTCPICENYFEKALKPKDEVVIISKEAVCGYDMNIKPGFYQVKEWPYYRANCVTGFEFLFENAIKLIKEVDINSMLRKLQPHNGSEKVAADECCHDCMKLYTGQKRIINYFVDKEYGKKRVKFMREVIKAGK